MKLNIVLKIKSIFFLKFVMVELNYRMPVYSEIHHIKLRRLDD